MKKLLAKLWRWISRNPDVVVPIIEQELEPKDPS